MVVADDTWMQPSFVSRNLVSYTPTSPRLLTPPFSQDREWFGVSVCTVDGQRFDVGDVGLGFSIQSCVKPLAYAVAVEDIGVTQVHQHVGCAPSGVAFNEISLNDDNLPHNPMVRRWQHVTWGVVIVPVNIAAQLEDPIVRCWSLLDYPAPMCAHR